MCSKELSKDAYSPQMTRRVYRNFVPQQTSNIAAIIFNVSVVYKVEPPPTVDDKIIEMLKTKKN